MQYTSRFLYLFFYAPRQDSDFSLCFCYQPDGAPGTRVVALLVCKLNPTCGFYSSTGTNDSTQQNTVSEYIQLRSLAVAPFAVGNGCVHDVKRVLIT